MKIIFIPFVKCFQWIGKLLRIIWNGKKIKAPNPEVEKKITYTNGWIGAAFTLVLTVIGLFTSVSKSDIHLLDKTIRESYESMEKTDIAISSFQKEKDSEDKVDSIAKRLFCLGVKQKLILNNVRDVIELRKELSGSIDTISADSLTILYKKIARIDELISNEMIENRPLLSREFIFAELILNPQYNVNDTLAENVKISSPELLIWVENNRNNNFKEIDMKKKGIEEDLSNLLKKNKNNKNKIKKELKRILRKDNELSVDFYIAMAQDCIYMYDLCMRMYLKLYYSEEKNRL